VKVTFLQSGGFAGATRGCAVDSALLDPEAAREVEGLVQASRLTASGTSLSPAARDLKQYEIAVERRGPGDRGAVRVVFDDSTVPPAARALLAYLKQRARPTRPA